MNVDWPDLKSLYERVALLEDERDRAREECGHEKAMRQSQREELTHWVERFVLAKKALVATGYFTEEQIGWDLAPRVTELFSAWTEASEALAAVRELHQPIPGDEYSSERCATCIGFWDSKKNNFGHTAWPCLTAQALDGKRSSQ